MKKFFEKIMNIDRRWIYLIIAIFVAIPLIRPLKLKTSYTPTVTKIFDYIEKLGPDDAIMVVINYDGSTQAELEPMARSIIRHAFLRNIKVLGYTFTPLGAAISQNLIDNLAKEYGKVDGVDYVNFGYKYPSIQVVLGMGKDIIEAMNKTDINGKNLEEMPVLKNIKNYKDIDLIVDMSGSSAYGTWIVYARGKYGNNIAAGVTGVIGAEVYPYINSGQLIGAMVGLKGGAEYEKHVSEIEKEIGYEKNKIENLKKILIEEYKLTEGTPEFEAKFKEKWRVWDIKNSIAMAGMDAQAIAHLVIIIFIIIGNIGYFVTKYYQKNN